MTGYRCNFMFFKAKKHRTDWPWDINMAWLTAQQITEMGFASVGSNVLLSDKASYYNYKNILL